MLINVEFLQNELVKPFFEVKMVFNENGAIFFSVDKHHRDMKGPGISYEDDYKGNALAAMLAFGKVEIRFHGSFSDVRVASIVSSLIKNEGLIFLDGWQVTYQGRVLKIE